jgi:hypothetical protein
MILTIFSRAERQFISTVPSMEVPGELPPADELSISQHNRDRILRAVERYMPRWEAYIYQEVEELTEILRRIRLEGQERIREERQQQESRERASALALDAAPWYPLAYAVATCAVCRLGIEGLSYNCRECGQHFHTVCQPALDQQLAEGRRPLCASWYVI